MLRPTNDCLMGRQLLLLMHGFELLVASEPMITHFLQQACDAIRLVDKRRVHLVAAHSEYLNEVLVHEEHLETLRLLQQ